MEEFKQVLYGSEYEHKVTLRSLRLDRDKRMTRTSLRKSGLTDIHVKMGVNWDRVVCEPLKLNGQYL